MKWIKYLPLALRIAGFIYSQLKGKDKEEVQRLLQLIEDVISTFTLIFTTAKDEVTRDMLLAELHSIVDGSKDFEGANS